MNRAKFVALLQRANGWKLWTSVILVTILVVEAIVAALDLLLYGHVVWDDMLKGLVATAIVEPTHLVFMVFMLGEFAKAERRAIQLSEAHATSRLSIAIENTEMIVWEIDFPTGELRYDQNMLHLFGMPEGTVASDLPSWLALVHEADREGFIARYQEVLVSADGTFDYEYRLAHPQGSFCWVHTRGQVVSRDKQGQPLSAVGTTINTTTRKQTEQALLEEKRRFELIFTHTPDLMVISRLSDGIITHVNEAMLKASGYSREEVIGNTTIGLQVWRDVEDRQRMTEALMRDGYCKDIQATFTAKDGKQFIGAISAVVVVIDGQPHIVSTVRDITEQLRAEAELQDSQILLRSTLESTDEGVLMIAQDGRVLSANKRFAELWHVPPELAAAGRDDLLLAHVLDQLCEPQVFMDQVQRLYDSDDEARDVLDFKDGRVFARYTRALKIGEERGRIWCFKDITEQAIAQSQLAEREEMFRSIFSQASDGILLIDPVTTRIVEFNDAACDDLGYSREAFAGLAIRDIQAEHDEATIARINQTVIAAGSMVFETVHRHRDGSKRSVRVSIKLIKVREQDYLVALVADITARKQMELALAESNQLLNAVIDTAPVRIFWKDKALRYLGCNSLFARDAGLEHPRDLIGKDDYQLGWREQADLYRADDKSVMESGVPRLNYDEPQTTPGGGRIWLRTSKVPLRDVDGQIIGLFGLYEDITARKRDEEALIASERKLSAVLDNVDAYIYLKDTEGRYLFANRPVLELWQVGIDQVVGRDDSSFFDAATTENIRRNDAKVLQEGETVRAEETNTVPATGVTSTYLSTKLPLRHEDGSIYALCGISTDITARKKIENSLLESEKRLHLALDAAHMGVWEYDFRNKALYWSPEILAHLQLPLDSDEALQQTLLRIVHPDDRGIFQHAMRRAVAEHRPYLAVYRLVVKGRTYWSEDRGDILYDAQGQPLRIIGTAQDITERKLISQALEESEAALRESQIIAGLGNYVLDMRTGLWTSSPLLDRLLGIDDAYVRTVAGWEALIHPDDRQMMHDYFLQEVVGEKHMFDKEYRIVRCTDGAVRWVAGLGKLEFDAQGGPVRMLGTIQDITERKLAEEAFKQLNVELEQRVQQRTAQLLYANRAKDSFLATMSHEIRTPLGGLLGMLELLSLTRLDQDQRDTLRVAGQSGESLLRIVDDILDWSKIEAGKLELAPRPSSIVQLVQGVVNTYSQLANSKNIMLQQQVDAQLQGLYAFDPLRVSQILNNFTSNAIKFTAQGWVRVTAQLLSRHEGLVTVRLSVIDSGAGIDRQHQARLFQHYEQASADTARMYGGTGLGLSICRSLADLMEATIHVDSTPGKGSTFSLTLNLLLVDAKVGSQPESALPSARTQVHEVKPLVAAGQQVKLLIVDDHPVNRLLLKQQLGLLGVQVDAAADGVEALAMWREGRYDLVITDCHMPEMDGYALTAHIRASEAGSARHVPVIAWTANVLVEEEEHCHSAGMDDILTKPTDLNELRAKLEQWLPALTRPVEREAAQQGDAATVRTAAHRVKGACRMMGARQLEQVCMAIEAAARQADMAGVQRLLAADLADAEQALRRVIQQRVQ